MPTHHYLEDEKGEADEAVRFNAVIAPPMGLPPVPTQPPPPTPMPEACCPAPCQSELLDALPMILVGIGIAYMVGVATSACIFYSPLE